MTTPPETMGKRFATLQAAAALRGITVSEMQDGRYFVSHSGFYLRVVTDIEALAALLARMGVVV